MQSNRKNKRPSGNIMMRLAAVLFCLVMISTHLMGGLYARYVTKGTGSDSARVAKFDVEGSGSGEIALQAESTAEGKYTINVTNNSEVDVSYDVDVVFNKDVVNWVNLQIDGKTAAETLEEGVTTFHFDNVGVLDPGVSQSKEILFLPEAGMTKEMTGLSGSLAPMNFTVYIHAVQID